MSVQLGPIHVTELHVYVTPGKNDMTIMLMSSPLNKFECPPFLSLCVVKVPGPVTRSVVLSDAISAFGPAGAMKPGAADCRSAEVWPSSHGIGRIGSDTSWSETPFSGTPEQPPRLQPG